MLENKKINDIAAPLAGIYNAIQISIHVGVIFSRLLLFGGLSSRTKSHSDRR